jgi:hypothetical protein
LHRPLRRGLWTDKTEPIARTEKKVFVNAVAEIDGKSGERTCDRGRTCFASLRATQATSDAHCDIYLAAATLANVIIGSR